MKILSEQSLKMVSGGEYTKEGYEGSTLGWSVIGTVTAASSMNLLPTPFGDYFAAKLLFVGVGSVAGYAVGAAQYYLTQSAQSAVDAYFAPAE